MQMISYVLIACIALYFWMVQLVSNTRFEILPASLITVLGYFLINRVVMAVGSGLGMFVWLGVNTVVELIIQFVIAVFVFRKIKDDTDESYSGWLFWGVAGCIGIFFAAPYLANLLV